MPFSSESVQSEKVQHDVSSSSNGVRSHRPSHAQDKNIKADSSDSIQLKNESAAEPHRWRCALCEITFSNAGNLTRHLRAKHCHLSIDEQLCARNWSEATTSIRKRNCPLCDLTSIWPWTVQRHLVYSHNLSCEEKSYLMS